MSGKLPPSPRLTLPEPLRGADPDYFAYNTISERLPNIARRVLSDRDWDPATSARLQALIDDMPDGTPRLIQDHKAPDCAEWVRSMEPYLNQTWLQSPWFVVETYFYRLILEATGYYQPGPGHHIDPYALQKKQVLAGVYQSLRALYDQITLPKDDASPLERSETLANLLRLTLWGNQADLSLWPAEDGAQPDHPTTNQLNTHLLIDDANSASQHLIQQETSPVRVDFILDNGGVELAYDLALADYLLTSTPASRVLFHLKPHPTYVSDATLQDVLDMLEFLASAPDSCVKALVQRLCTHLEVKRLTLHTHYYWTSPLSGWEMPTDLRQELRLSNLLVSKGDANYRRWLGDRHWPFTTSIADIWNYLPAPLIAQRVLKSNVVTGLQPGQSQVVEEQDPLWMYNGEWGLIQFSTPDQEPLPETA